jgi:phage terminase large subunit-like protein
VEEVYDFEVEGWHNYIAADLVHHNSEMGAYEMTCHLTGGYPGWWTGRRFTRPVRAWAAGDTSKTVRGILQVKLLGPIGQMGTGMIPKELIHHVSRKTGVADAYEQCWVTHVTGGYSHLEMKSYDQRREAFQGTTMDVIWLDEEPPLEIYTECLLRTATTNGILYMTFTPLQGPTDLIVDFMKDAEAA